MYVYIRGHPANGYYQLRIQMRVDSATAAPLNTISPDVDHAYTYFTLNSPLNVHVNTPTYIYTNSHTHAPRSRPRPRPRPTHTNSAALAQHRGGTM